MSDYGYEDLSPEDKAEELADLQARMVALAGEPAPETQVSSGATAPAEPVLPDRAALLEKVAGAKDMWEANAIVARFNEEVREATAPVRAPVNHADLNERIANAKSPAEVMALLKENGIPSSADVRD